MVGLLLFLMQLTAPTGLVATCSADGTQVTLAWSSVSGATGYYLRVDNTTNNITPDDWFKDPATEYSINDLHSTTFIGAVAPNAPYSWWVHGAAANIGPSTSGTFTCAPSVTPPSNVTDTVSGSVVGITWDKNVEANVVGYNVYRASESGTFTKLNQSPVTGTTYKDSPVSVGVYTYHVTAVTTTGDESSPSNNLIMTVTAAVSPPTNVALVKDTIAPTITRVSYAGVTIASGGTVTVNTNTPAFTVAAADNLGNLSAQLIVDNIPVAQSMAIAKLPATFTLTWFDSPIVAGLHPAEVRVFDGSGNTVSFSFTIKR